MDQTPEEKIVVAELGGAPSIDLHGDSVDVALGELKDFFYREQGRKTEVIQIIHGRGTGKLREAVHRWLETQKKKDEVLAYREGYHPGQQGGVTFAVIHVIMPTYSQKS